MLRVHPLAITLLLCATTAAAQDAPAQPHATAPQPEHANGRILGIILCSDTGKPARGAPVYLNGFGGAKTTTDADGRYEFDALKPGVYTLRLGFIGYLGLQHDGIHVGPNETAVVNLTAERGAALSGRVIFSDGSPAIRARIRVEDAAPRKLASSESEPEGRVHAGDILGLATDDRGYFRVSGYRPGTYRIAAVPVLQVGLMVEPELPNALAVFSEGTIHRAEAKTYTLGLGEEANEIQIVIPLDLMHRVQGTVTSTDGRTVNSGNVMLIDKSDKAMRYSVSLNSSGFILQGVPSGTYDFELTHASIEIPDPQNHDTDRIDTNFFADVSSSVIVKDSDILDLHFEVNEIPKPPKPPEPPEPPDDELRAAREGRGYRDAGS